MKVLHIVKTAVGATWVYHLVRVLRSLGMEIVVALPSDTEGLAPRYRETGATVVKADVDFPSWQPWRLPSVLRRCRELVARTQPDIIHTHHVGTTYVARLALGKASPIPRVFWVPGGLHLEHWLYSKLDVGLAGPRDYWIGINRWIGKRYAALGVPPERVQVTHIGIEVSRFCPGRTGKLRRDLGIAPDAPLVGMVAYMYAPKLFLGDKRGVKGHEYLIEAMQQVIARKPEVRAVILGGPWGNASWYEERLRRMAHELCGEKLYFAGIRKDMPEIYADLDVSVLPSLSEGIPMASGEALLCGVPVVATSVGGLPDLIHDGETGWLVPPRDPAALARAILAALDHPDEARRRAQAGGALARTMLDAERTSREIAVFYEKILAAKS